MKRTCENCSWYGRPSFEEPPTDSTRVTFLTLSASGKTIAVAQCKLIPSSRQGRKPYDFCGQHEQLVKDTTP